MRWSWCHLEGLVSTTPAFDPPRDFRIATSHCVPSVAIRKGLESVFVWYYCGNDGSALMLLMSGGLLVAEGL